MNESPIELTEDDNVFLLSWEEVHKKSMLTFWVLQYLSQTELSASELYEKLSHDQVEVNEHSLYLMLRRFYDIDLIDQTSREGKVKYYRLSDKGRRILAAFTQNNIHPLYQLAATKGTTYESHR